MSKPEKPEGSSTESNVEALEDARWAWKGCRRWTAALVMAGFPFPFLVDQWGDYAVSPVLPGLVGLLLLMLLLPFLLMEFHGRRARRRPPEVRTTKARSLASRGRFALVLATVWVVAWFAGAV